MDSFPNLSVTPSEKPICSFQKKVSFSNLVTHGSANKDEEGKPIIGPRNFTTRPTLKGKTEKVYFARAASYTSIGDPFKEMNLQMRESVKDGHLKAGHDRVFRPAKHFRQDDYKASFVHQSDLVEVKKNYRDEEGKVRIQPRNILTNPPKKGLVGK